MAIKTADALVGVAVVAAGGFLLYAYLQRGPASPPPGPNGGVPPGDLVVVPTEAEIQGVATQAEVKRLRALFEQAFANGQITRSEYLRLFIASFRQSYYLDFYLRGGDWIGVATEYWQRTEGVTNVDILHTIYMELYNFQKGNWPIKEQLASIQQNLVRVWISRNGVWYMYDPADMQGSDLYEIYQGDTVSIYVTRVSVLTYGGRSYNLAGGSWNEIIW